MKYHQDIYAAAAPIVGCTSATRQASIKHGNTRYYVGYRVEVIRPSGEKVSLQASEFDREVKRVTPKDVNLHYPDVKAGEVREIRVDGSLWYAHVVKVRHDSFAVKPLRCVAADGRVLLDGESVIEVDYVGGATREDVVRAQGEVSQLNDALRATTSQIAVSDPRWSEAVRAYETKVNEVLAKYPGVQRSEIDW